MRKQRPDYASVQTDTNMKPITYFAYVGLLNELLVKLKNAADPKLLFWFALYNSMASIE